MRHKVVMDYDACVQRGMRWLDTTYPGWLWRIDLERLWMSTVETCILGQLASCYGGNFYSECETRGLEWHTLVHLGIATHRHTRHSKEYKSAYGQLTATWKKAIASARVRPLTSLKSESLFAETAECCLAVAQ